MIERTSVRERIRDSIIERIVSGEYASGHRLIEMRLAHEFGTSQGPVREALRELEAQRLVVSESHRGTRVRAVEPTELVEIYHVRGALERLACEELQALGAAPTAELREIAEEGQEAGRAGDLGRFVEFDYRFHETIVRASKNAVLGQMWESLLTRTRVKVLASIAPRVLALGASLESFAEDHLRVVRAMEDGRDAGLELKRHLDEGAALVARAVQCAADEMLREGEGAGTRATP